MFGDVISSVYDTETQKKYGFTVVGKLTLVETTENKWHNVRTKHYVDEAGTKFERIIFYAKIYNEYEWFEKKWRVILQDGTVIE